MKGLGTFSRNQLELVTRNTTHFHPIVNALLNPWT
jgi:predicted nucleic acid-binding protein